MTTSMYKSIRKQCSQILVRFSTTSNKQNHAFTTIRFQGNLKIPPMLRACRDNGCYRALDRVLIAARMNTSNVACPSVFWRLAFMFSGGFWRKCVERHNGIRHSGVKENTPIPLSQCKLSPELTRAQHMLDFHSMCLDDNPDRPGGGRETVNNISCTPVYPATS